jgi:hypothetical protein
MRRTSFRGHTCNRNVVFGTLGGRREGGISRLEEIKVNRRVVAVLVWMMVEQEGPVSSLDLVRRRRRRYREKTIVVYLAGHSGIYLHSPALRSRGVMASTAASPSTSSTSSTHAYAIVSTSSALLSRSNSSNSSLNRHSFSPTHDYQRHRHSKSLNSDVTPLPTPPSTLRVKPFRPRSGAETDSSGYSDASSDFADLGPVTDPFLCDLRNNLLPVSMTETY